MTKLSDLVSKITYSDDSNDEVVKSIVQSTKNNKELTLIKKNKALTCSEDRYVGILKRKANLIYPSIDKKRGIK